MPQSAVISRSGDSLDGHTEFDELSYIAIRAERKGSAIPYDCDTIKEANLQAILAPLHRSCSGSSNSVVQEANVGLLVVLDLEVSATNPVRIASITEILLAEARERCVVEGLGEVFESESEVEDADIIRG